MILNTTIEEDTAQRQLALRIAITCASGRKYKSIDNLIWESVPPFAIVTGLNGSGKTQLLEVLAYKLTGTMTHGLDLNGLEVSITGDSFGPDSVAYLPSRWEFTPAAHVGIPQMQHAREQLWSEVYQQSHNIYDFRAVTKRARIKNSLVKVGTIRKRLNGASQKTTRTCSKTQMLLQASRTCWWRTDCG